MSRRRKWIKTLTCDCAFIQHPDGAIEFRRARKCQVDHGRLVGWIAKFNRIKTTRP